MVGDDSMNIKEVFFLCKLEINPKINYIRQIKENRFLAQGSSGSCDLIRYLFSIKNNKLNIIKIEEGVS